MTCKVTLQSLGESEDPWVAETLSRALGMEMMMVQVCEGEPKAPPALILPFWLESQSVAWNCMGSTFFLNRLRSSSRQRAELSEGSRGAKLESQPRVGRLLQGRNEFKSQ